MLFRAVSIAVIALFRLGAAVWRAGRYGPAAGLLFFAPAAMPQDTPAQAFASDSYQGQLRMGIPHGRGTLSYREGDRYQGEFVDGLPHGRGVLESAEGDRFEGGFRMGLRHGPGVLITAEGERYEGMWADGAEASAVLTQAPPVKAARTSTKKIAPSRVPVPVAEPDAPSAPAQAPQPDPPPLIQTAFEKQIESLPPAQVEQIQARLNALGYHAGPVDGKIGRMTRAAVRTYAVDHALRPTEIDLTSFRRHVMGRHPDTTPREWPSDRADCKAWVRTIPARLSIEWSGACENGLASGTGTLRADFVIAGQKGWFIYEGEMHAGKWSGQGTLSWHGSGPFSGDRYGGNFADGDRSGLGTYHYSNGATYHGSWRHDQPHGSGTYSTPTFGRLVGSFANGRPNGSATHFDPSGRQRVSGHFRDGCLKVGGEWIYVLTTRDACGF